MKRSAKTAAVSNLNAWLLALILAGSACTTAKVEPAREAAAPVQAQIEAPQVVATTDTQRDPAAVQKTTVPYGHFKSQLEMKPGKTFLEFMMKEVKPAIDSYDKDLRDFVKTHPGQWSKIQAEFIESGKGVAIRIDRNNYFFNVGYHDGSGGESDLKSGRSYGVGPTNRQSDPSDIFYLRELERYLGTEPDAADDFFRAIMLVLTNNDASGWSKLSVAGQMVATDFLAIYTAELDRHLMINLAYGRHPWEIDLAAATFVSAFCVPTGLMMTDGRLSKGSLEGWWAKGATGSGIGNTRRDRKKLQRLIAGYEMGTKSGAALIGAVEKITGANREHDVIQQVFEYLSKPPRGPGRINSKALTDAMVKYIEQVRHDAAVIAKSQ